MLWNYLKLAWRTLYKNKTTGFINIAGLAIGMAVAMMIGLWVHDELNYDRYHKNYDHLAQVMINQTVGGQVRTGEAQAMPLGAALHNEYADNFEGVSMSSWHYDHILEVGEIQLLRGGKHVEPDFTKMISLDFVEGSQEEALKEPHSIIIAESLSEALFSGENPMGKTIHLDAVSDMKVTGVFKDLPENTSFGRNEFYLPWSYFIKQNNWAQNAQTQWGNHSFPMYVQKKAKARFAAINAKISNAEKPHNPEANPEIFLHPMPKWHLYSDFENGASIGGRIQYVRLFGLIGLFVLLLACINFMNLSTARSEKRAKEVGIRKAVGSQRQQLIGQFLTESLLVTFLALLLAVALVQLSLTPFNNLADKAIEIPWSNPVFWSFFLGIALFTGFVAGSYPAFYLSSFEPLKVLKANLRTGRKAQLPRQVLVTLQFTISVALIIGTIVVFQQINHAKNRPVGYNRAGLISFESNQETHEKFEVIENEMLQSGAVRTMAYSSSPATSVWSNTTSYAWEGKNPEELISFGNISCSYEYGKTIQWKIIQGRDFSKAFSTDTEALIMNEAAFKQVGDPDIVGKMITRNENSFQVVGVIEDMVMQSPWRPVKPTMFTLDSGEDRVNVFTLQLNPAMPTQEALRSVEQIMRRHSPSSPFEFEFLDEAYASKFFDEVRIGKLARIFAILAIFISCLGLFGLSAFVAEQRTKELGIRKVLGASITNLWMLQAKGFLILVILACAIAIPIAWYFLDGWLDQYQYRIQLSWVVFVLAAAIALMITFITVSLQSIKAALINPVKSLRSE